MANSSSTQYCSFLHVLEVPSSSAIKSTAILTSSIGFLVAIGAIIGNAFVLFVIMKFDRLQTPSNLLLGNLCITDFITGMIVLPLSTARRLSEAYNKHLCTVRLVCAYFAFLCVVTSIVNVGIISIDRYYAITMPFRYQVTATNTKYLAVISFLWLILGVFALLPFIGVLTASNFFRVTFALMGLTMIIFLFAYIMILRIVQSHRRKIVPIHLHINTTITQEAAADGGASYMKKEQKKAHTIAIVVSFALVSYLPLAIIFILRGIIGDTVMLVTIADPWADLILHLNSVINPTIYCLRSKEIREAIKRTLPDPIRNFVARFSKWIPQKCSSYLLDEWRTQTPRLWL